MSLLATGSSMSSNILNDVVANLTEITILFLSPINFDHLGPGKLLLWQ